MRQFHGLYMTAEFFHWNRNYNYEKNSRRESEFTRYFITSLTDVDEFAYAVRKHWSIENQLHWCLDVIFREDAARARKEMSPRKTALSLLN